MHIHICALTRHQAFCHRILLRMCVFFILDLFSAHKFSLCPIEWLPTSAENQPFHAEKEKIKIDNNQAAAKQTNCSQIQPIQNLRSRQNI